MEVKVIAKPKVNNATEKRYMRRRGPSCAHFLTPNASTAPPKPHVIITLPTKLAGGRTMRQNKSAPDTVDHPIKNQTRRCVRKSRMK
jgi:hypothetical protein